MSLGQIKILFLIKFQRCNSSIIFQISFILNLTKSCSHPPISWFVVTIKIIPLPQGSGRILVDPPGVDIDTVLASTVPVPIVWLPRIPVGEDNTFASWFENPISLRVTIGDAEPEFNFPWEKVALLDLGNDGSVFLHRVDLNEASWDFLLFFAELLGFTLCHWGLVEPWGERAGE